MPGEVIVRAAIELHVAEVVLCVAVRIRTFTHMYVYCVVEYT